MRVTISRRDTADTAITTELLDLVHIQSGTEVDCGVSETEMSIQDVIFYLDHQYTECN